MSDGVTIDLPKEDWQALADAVKRMEEVTGAEGSKVIRNTGRDIVRALIRRTRVAPKKVSMRLGNGRYVVGLYHRYTGEFVKFVGTRAQAAQYSIWGSSKKIVGRGFAKAGWLKAARGLGIGISSVARGEGRLEYGDFENRLKQAGNPEVEIANQVPYIEGLDHQDNILGGAVREVIGKMDERIDRMWQRSMERQWKK